MPKLGWRFAPSVAAPLREALRQAFQPAERLRPVVGAPGRGVSSRGYGLLPRAGAVPGEVFVKVFHRNSFGSRLRRLLGRGQAEEEFAHLLRLRQMGLPVPQPLALVHEKTVSGQRRTYLWMECVAGARSLAELLRSGALREEEHDRLARAVARVLVDLAAQGAWHRDVRPENLLVSERRPPEPPAVTLVDLRHMVFSSGPSPAAMEDMLVTLAGFLLAAGAGEERVTQVVQAAADLDRRESRGLVRSPVEAVIGRGVALGHNLVNREVRKGRRPVAALDTFARRYGTADDAENYRDRRFGRSAHGRRVDAAERRCVERLIEELAVGGPVLDAPCGTGRFLAILGAGGRRVIGTDVAEAMLRLARQSARSAGLECAFLAADVRRLPLADKAVDLAFSMRLLHRVEAREERAQVLKELGRVSRQWVLCSFYNCRSWRGLRDRMRGRYAGQTRRAIAREAAEAGLRVERFVPVGPLARQTLVVCTVACPERSRGGASTLDADPHQA